MKKDKVDQVLQIERMLWSIPECKDEDYMVSPVPEELRKLVYDEQKGRCLRCGIDSPTFMVHHIRPDGPATRENLVGLCSWCHTDVMWMLHQLKGYRKRPRFMAG
jgi:5-methylcytosine-specific restriction endonuclease McrA